MTAKKKAETSRDSSLSEEEVKTMQETNLFLRKQLGERDNQLGGLLAIIHRDGGLYTSSHGWEISVKHAEIKLIEILKGDKK